MLLSQVIGKAKLIHEVVYHTVTQYFSLLRHPPLACHRSERRVSGRISCAAPPSPWWRNICYRPFYFMGLKQPYYLFNVLTDDTVGIIYGIKEKLLLHTNVNSTILELHQMFAPVLAERSDHRGSVY